MPPKKRKKQKKQRTMKRYDDSEFLSLSMYNFTPQPISPVLFKTGQIVWCEWNYVYYRAKVLKIRLCLNEDQYYYIHYWKFSKTWDMVVSHRKILSISSENDKFIKSRNNEVKQFLKVRKAVIRTISNLKEEIKDKPILQQKPFLVLHKKVLQPNCFKFRIIDGDENNLLPLDAEGNVMSQSVQFVKSECVVKTSPIDVSPIDNDSIVDNAQNSHLLPSSSKSVQIICNDFLKSELNSKTFSRQEKTGCGKGNIEPTIMVEDKTEEQTKMGLLKHFSSKEKEVINVLDNMLTKTKQQRRHEVRKEKSTMCVTDTNLKKKRIIEEIQNDNQGTSTKKAKLLSTFVSNKKINESTENSDEKVEVEVKKIGLKKSKDKNINYNQNISTNSNQSHYSSDKNCIVFENNYSQVVSSSVRTDLSDKKINICENQSKDHNFETALHTETEFQNIDIHSENDDIMVMSNYQLYLASKKNSVTNKNDFEVNLSSKTSDTINTSKLSIYEDATFKEVLDVKETELEKNNKSKDTAIFHDTNFIDNYSSSNDNSISIESDYFETKLSTSTSQSIDDKNINAYKSELFKDNTYMKLKTHKKHKKRKSKDKNVNLVNDGTVDCSREPKADYNVETKKRKRHKKKKSKNVNMFLDLDDTINSPPYSKANNNFDVEITTSKTEKKVRLNNQYNFIDSRNCSVIGYDEVHIDLNKEKCYPTGTINLNTTEMLISDPNLNSEKDVYNSGNQIIIEHINADVTTSESEQLRLNEKHNNLKDDDSENKLSEVTENYDIEITSESGEQLKLDEEQFVNSKDSSDIIDLNIVKLVDQFDKEVTTSKPENQPSLENQLNCFNSECGINGNKSNCEIFNVLMTEENQSMKTLSLHTTTMLSSEESNLNSEEHTLDLMEIDPIDTEVTTSKPEELLELNNHQDFIDLKNDLVYDNLSSEELNASNVEESNTSETSNCMTSALSDFETNLDNEKHTLNDFVQLDYYDVEVTTSKSEHSSVDEQEELVYSNTSSVIDSKVIYFNEEVTTSKPEEDIHSEDQQDFIDSKNNSDDGCEIIYNTSNVEGSNISKTTKLFNTTTESNSESLLENCNFDEEVTTSKPEQQDDQQDYRNLIGCSEENLYYNVSDKYKSKESNHSKNKNLILNTTDLFNTENNLDSNEIETIYEKQKKKKKYKMHSKSNHFGVQTVSKDNFINKNQSVNENVIKKLKAISSTTTESSSKKKSYIHKDDYYLADNINSHKKKRNKIIIIDKYHDEDDVIIDLRPDLFNYNSTSNKSNSDTIESSSTTITSSTNKNKKIKNYKDEVHNDNLNIQKAKACSSTSKNSSSTKNKFKDHKGITYGDDYVKKAKASSSTSTTKSNSKHKINDYKVKAIDKSDYVKEPPKHFKPLKGTLKDINIFLGQDDKHVDDYQSNHGSIDNSTIKKNSSELMNSSKLTQEFNNKKKKLSDHRLKKTDEDSYVKKTKTSKPEKGTLKDINIFSDQDDNEEYLLSRHSLKNKSTFNKSNNSSVLASSSKLTTKLRIEKEICDPHNVIEKKDNDNKKTKPVKHQKGTLKNINIFSDQVDNGEPYFPSRDTSNKNNSGICSSTLTNNSINKKKINDHHDKTIKEHNVEKIKLTKKKKKSKNDDSIYYDKDFIINKYHPHLVSNDNSTGISNFSNSSTSTIVTTTSISNSSNSSTSTIVTNNQRKLNSIELEITDVPKQSNKHGSIGNWSSGSASSSTKQIHLSNTQIESDDIDGHTTDDDDQYVKNRKVSKKKSKSHDIIDPNLYELYLFEKPYSRAAKVKANEAISLMSKPPIGKEKKNDVGKRSKNGRKKDDDDPFSDWPIKTFLNYNLDLPLLLKQISFQDKHLVVDDRFMTVLPAKVSVRKIVGDFIRTYGMCKSTANVMLNLFNRALYDVLLHPIERPKYMELLERYPNNQVSEIYGLPHLVRFIVKMPLFFRIWKLSANNFIPFAIHFLRGLLIYIVDHQLNITINDYNNILPDYFRTSYYNS